MTRLRQLMITLLGLLLLTGLLAPAVSADTPQSVLSDPAVTTLTDAQEAQAAAGTPAQVASYPCRSGDHFTYSVVWMEHFFHCNHVPFDVYTIQGGTKAPDTDPAPGVGPAIEPGFTPDAAAGGPACSWQTKHILEICYQRGVGHLICAQYWSGYYYPYHCGPTAAYNLTHAQSLWSVVSHAFTSHAAKACVRGTVGGAATGAILKVAGASTGIGIFASLAGGCVGGLITYFWRI